MLQGQMESMTIGDVRVDVPGNRLVQDGKWVRVEPKAMQVLVLLVENAGLFRQPVTRIQFGSRPHGFGDDRRQCRQS